MRALIIAALLVSAAAALPVEPRSHEQLFAEFKTKHGRTYATPAEEEHRFGIFSANMRRAAELNHRNPQATFGVNKFSDVSHEEFVKRHKGYNPPKEVLEHRRAEREHDKAATLYESMPCTYIDWREKGVVTPIKNQADCGGCWAFSTTGVIEGQWAMAGNPLTSLSEQLLISCDTNDLGCDGGDESTPMAWSVHNISGHFVTEKAYPFKSGDGISYACNPDYKKLEVGATIIGWRFLKHNERDMADFLCKGGPISIAVDATTFETYTGGIVTDCVAVEVDHAVLIVGMDLIYATPYWIIKNQWGTDWGEDGYIRVEFGKDECFINSDPLVPLI